MQKTPKSLRLHIGIFGRRNVGKSSLLNALTRQQIALVSDFKGTTTDPIEKPMELLPLGPVVFIDTAGLDDEGDIGELRMMRTRAMYDKCDLALVVTDSDWGSHEKEIAAELDKRQIPWIGVRNKCDNPEIEVLSDENIVCTSTVTGYGLENLLQKIIQKAPEDFLGSMRILGDFIVDDAHILLVVPIDKEAPKGRLIMPQVQTIRDILDAHAVCTVCREDKVAATLAQFKTPPSLVVTDSQVFGTVNAQVPAEIQLTSFSVLFARFKGDLQTLAQGARQISKLRAGDKVLIAEACTHHPIQDDIGTVKIPNWLHQKVDAGVQVEFCSGPEFPENLSQYALIIHCGGCVWTRRQMLSRIHRAAAQNVPITNYGLAIAAMHGILDRAMEPFDR